MKRIILSLLSSMFLFAAFSQVTGDYRSKTSGNWNVAASWERYNGTAWVAAVASPTSADGVITILSGHTITNNGTVTVDQVVVNSGGQLTQISPLTLNNGTGDDLNVSGTLYMNSGSITGSGTLKVSGTMGWDGGSLSVVTTLQNGSTLNLNGGEVILFSTLINNGTINWNAGYLSLNNGTLINNKNFNAVAYNSLVNQGGGVFTNSSTGIFNELSGTGFTYSSVAFTNNGTMNFNSGTFQNQGSFTNTGPMVFAGGTFRSDAPASLNAGTTITGSGAVIQANNTMTINVAVNLPATIPLTFTGGTINGTGSFQINGILQWNGGSLQIPATLQSTATTNLDGGEVIIFSTFTNNGTVNWNAGYLSFNNGTLINNKNFNAVAYNSLLNYAGGIFTNSSTGIFNELSGTGITYSSIAFTNNGTMNFNSGTFQNQGSFTNTGPMVFAGGTFTSYAPASLNTGTTITGSGAITQGNNTMTINVAVNLPATIPLTFMGGTINGTGSFQISGTLQWNGGSLQIPTTLKSSSTTNLDGGEVIIFSTLTNNGTINWNAGYLSFNNGSLINNKNFNAVAYNSLYNYGAGIFTNSSTGTFNELSGTGITYSSVAFTNNGTMNFNSGTFQNAGSFTNTGPMVFAGGTFTSYAPVSLNAGTTITGSGALIQGNSTMTINVAVNLPATIPLTFTGGTINGTGSFQISGTLQWNAGSLQIPATLESNSITNLDGGEVVIFSTITNNGTINWNNGYLSFNNGTLINNKNFNAVAYNSLNNYGAGIFTNSSTGIFNELSGTGTTYSSVAFTNNGTLNFNSGTFQNAGSFTNTGPMFFAGGTLRSDAPASLNAGTTITGSGAIIQGNNTMTINVAVNLPANIAFTCSGGTINGSGSIKVTGAMQWNGGTLSLPATFQNNAVVNLDGGEVIINSTLTNSGTINWNAGYLSFNAGTLVNNKNLNIASNDQMYNYGGGSCTNNAAGVFSKTSTGTTTVSIPVTNNGRISGVGAYSFGTGLLNNKGIFAPGSYIGILTTGVDYTNKTLEIQMLNGSGPGTGHDQLAVNGKAKLKDTLRILRTGTVPRGSYTILTSTGAISGGFDTIIAPGGYVVAKAGKTIRVTVPDPGVTISDTAVVEGNAGNKQIKFAVNLAFPSNLTGTIDYQTVDSTATTSGNDYVAKAGTLTFTPGKVSDTISVSVRGDTLTEADEVFYIKLLNPVNLVIVKEKGIGTIINNDGLTSFTVNGFTSDPITATKLSASSLIIPNLLHRNQQWKINGLAENNTVTIFDSKGVNVFRESNYKNNNNLSQLAAGLYYYQVLVHEKNGKPTIYKGKLVILQ
ncbi:MAG TPA: Calx-beta domain-containing protein [Panacibacter sp.]|nr:Calx-beta domain-containing protein [Panacibacter sp.]